MRADETLDELQDVRSRLRSLLLGHDWVPKGAMTMSVICLTDTEVSALLISGTRQRRERAGRSPVTYAASRAAAIAATIFIMEHTEGLQERMPMSDCDRRLDE